MICRFWRGWTRPEQAAAYEHIVRNHVIPDIEHRAIPGLRHIDLVRRDPAETDDGHVEFATLMWFDTVDDVRRFVGTPHRASHVPAEARAVLARFDETAAHFEVLDRRPQPVTAAAAAAVRLPADATLVVIDVQAGFNDAAWGSRNNPDAEANVGRLLAAWRRAGRPVAHVRHASRSPDGHFWPSSAGYEFKPAAMPVVGEPIYVKSVNSAFIGTSLEADLRAKGVSTLVLAGLTTNHCVSTTARTAGNLGFDTYVVSDATATFDRLSSAGLMRSAQDVHEAALGDLQDEFASIFDTEAILESSATYLHLPVPASGSGPGGHHALARFRATSPQSSS